MKILLSWLLIWSSLLTTTVHAQTSPGKRVDGTVFTGKAMLDTNYVKAPQPYLSSTINSSTTATSSATLARDNTSPNLFQGLPSYSCDASAINGYCEFKLITITSPALSGLCTSQVYVKGDASLYSVQITDGTTVIGTTSFQNVLSDYTGYEVQALCGATRTVRITQTAAGTAPAINIGFLSYGIYSGQKASFDYKAVGYTPTITNSTGTVTNYTLGFTQARNSNYLVIDGLMTFTGSPGVFSQIFFTLPSGLQSIIGGGAVEGSCNISASSSYTGAVYMASTSSFVCLTNQVSGSYTLANAITQAAPITLVSGNSIGFHFRVPIQGWDAQPAVTAPNWNTSAKAYSGSLTYGATTATNITSQTYKYWRREDGIYVNAYVVFSGAANASGDLRFPLPSGMAVDTDKLSSVGGSFPSSPLYFQSTGTKAWGPGKVKSDSSTNSGKNNWIVIATESTSGVTASNWSGNTTAGSNIPVGAAMGSGDSVEFTAGPIPIIGLTNTFNALQLNGSYTSPMTVAGIKKMATVICGASSSAQTPPGDPWVTVGNVSGGRCSLTFSGFPNAIYSLIGNIGSASTSTVYSINMGLSSVTSGSIGCVTQSGATTAACTGTNTFLIEASGY